MAKLEQLSKNGQAIYPVTHESAVLDSNGVSIDKKMNEFKDGVNSELENFSGQLEAKANQTIINIKDFGAKGDGVNDDTVAIQNSIKSANTNDIILFPSTSHFYKVDGRFVIDKPLTIKGDNTPTIKVVGHDTDNKNSNLFESGRTYLFGIRSDNVKFENIHIDINSRNNYKIENGIKIYYASDTDACYPNGVTAIDTNEYEGVSYNNIVVDSCVIENASSSAISPLSGGNHKVLNCEIKGCLRDCVSVHFGNNITIENNKIHDNLWHSIHLYRAGNSDIKVMNNDIKINKEVTYPTNQTRSYIGIEIVRNNKNVTIENNNIKYDEDIIFNLPSSESAIYLLDYDRGGIVRDEEQCINLKIKNNTIENCPHGIYLEKPGDNFLLNDNIINNSIGYGFYINEFDLKRGYILDNNIHGCVINSAICNNNNEKTGMLFRYTNKIDVKNNNIVCGENSMCLNSIFIVGSSTYDLIFDNNRYTHSFVTSSNNVVSKTLNSVETGYYKKENIFKTVVGVSGGTTFLTLYVKKDVCTLNIDIEHIKTRVPNADAGTVKVSKDRFFIGRKSVSDDVVLLKSTNSTSEDFSIGGSYNASAVNMAISKDNSFVSDTHEKIIITGNGGSGYFVVCDIKITGINYYI